LVFGSRGVGDHGVWIPEAAKFYASIFPDSRIDTLTTG
jgi:predicted 3-demethylubiquinone-9 3-methyltransferase (glyoxalase superfamily)